MSAKSAHAQIPTRTSSRALDDFLVNPRRDDAEDADRLGDVLERFLAEALQHEVGAHALRGRRTDDDLAALVRLDDLEEAREVRLHELVELLRLELLGELRVARDVEEEDGHLDGLLLELRCARVLLEELLHRIGDELRELALELLEELEALPRLLEIPERALELRVIGRELLVRSGEARRHLVERRAELAQLVARAGGHPGREVAVADAT